MLAFGVIAAAARTYSSLAAGPWWQLPRPRLFRLLVLYVLAILGGSAVFVLAQTVMRLEHLSSFGDALSAWMAAIEFFLFFFVMFGIPALLLGHGWYAFTHRHALRRSAMSS